MSPTAIAIDGSNLALRPQEMADLKSSLVSTFRQLFYC